MSIEPGQTYRDPETDFVGIAQPHDKPVAGKTYRLVSDGSEVAAIGPDPHDESRWVVSDDTGSIRAIDRADLPFPYPRIGLIGAGPKGAPERRFFDPDVLVLEPTQEADNG